jgi:hypothetical protein
MLRKELEARVREVAKARELAHQTDDALARAVECAYFYIDESKAPSKLARGASRMGGLPDLPAHVDWPAGVGRDGKPAGHARFLAQFDLAEIPPLNDLDLPRKGHLWFFTPGYAQDVGPLVTVLFEPGEVELKQRRAPTQSEWGHWSIEATKTGALRFERGISVRVYSPTGTSEMSGGDDADQMIQLASRFLPHGYAGQIGGFYLLSQHNLYRDVAFLQLGKREARFADYWTSLDEYDAAMKRKPSVTGKLAEAYRKLHESHLKKRPLVEWIEQHRAQVNAEAAAWRLLCQFQARAVDLGEGGSLDVFIRKQDLAARDFSGVFATNPMLG